MTGTRERSALHQRPQNLPFTLPAGHMTARPSSTVSRPTTDDDYDTWRCSCSCSGTATCYSRRTFISSVSRVQHITSGTERIGCEQHPWGFPAIVWMTVTKTDAHFLFGFCSCWNRHLFEKVHPFDYFFFFFCTVVGLPHNDNIIVVKTVS